MTRYRLDEKTRVRALPLPVDQAPAHARAQNAWHRGAAMPGADGLAWLDRAHRLAPSDQNLCFALAVRRLQAGDNDAAASLFADMAHRFGVRECWCGLAAASLAANRIPEAEAAIQSALSTNEADPALAGLAERVAARAGRAGWCGLSTDGTLLSNLPHTALLIRLDDTLVKAIPMTDGTCRLPDLWQRSARLDVHAAGAALLGSPIHLATIRRVEGFAARHGDQVSGYVWQPGAPGHDPELRVLAIGEAEHGQEHARFKATKMRGSVEGLVPLARARAFAFEVPPGIAVRIIGSDGRDLLGSPLPPERPKPPQPVIQPEARRPDANLPVDVVIPVYRGLKTTLACIASVIGTVAVPHRIWVVDDASPEPALVDALVNLANTGQIGLIATGPAGAPNRGFPAAVNAGLRAATGRHVILLNSDTLVAPGWLETLREAACSAPDIGTATPLSNEASIFSYPDRDGGNPAPDLAGTHRLAALAARANAGRLVDVPTAHGFCMFIRADCLAETGLFDQDTFAQGYGEENDFSERARAFGWRHVAVPSVYVAHVGGVSFGAARADLLARNLAILERRHPQYLARVAAYVNADPLAAARRRLDSARWLARTTMPASVLLITHGGGGGTARIVAERAEAVRAQGLTPVMLRAMDGLCEVGEPGAEDAAGPTPNLAFALPRELGALRRLLQAGAPDHAELHHLLGHDHSVMGLLAALGIPYDVWVHDYAWFCARLSFVTGDGRFCGEADTATCDACVARWGRGIDDPVSPASLRRRSAADFRRARCVVVPSEDVARRVARHVPGLVPLVRPWEADPLSLPATVHPHGGTLRIAVVGAIGMEKGFDTLLACARDAEARALDLMFTIIGYTVDDDSLLATGRAFITGEFSRAEAAALIRAQSAHMAFLPSIWPETWCYALSDVWAAGLSAAVFNIGTPAARILQTGGGWLLPLGLPPPSINDALLSLGRER